MSEKERLLASLIPEIPCPDDCGECCEIRIGVQPRGYDSYIQYTYPEIENNCGAFKDGKCLVYEDRWFVCRVIFKTEGNALCPRGILPEGGLMSKEKSRRIWWCALYGTVDDARALVAYYRTDLQTTHLRASVLSFNCPPRVAEIWNTLVEAEAVSDKIVQSLLDQEMTKYSKKLDEELKADNE